MRKYKGYWKKYYKRNKKKLKAKSYEWRNNNPEKVREYQTNYRIRNKEKEKEASKERYRQWVSLEQNHQHKKEYQRVWFLKNSKYIKEERARLNSLLQTLKSGKAKINGYEVEVKQDKGGKWFYFLAQNKRLVYMSDKFNTKVDAVKDLEYAL